MKPSFAIVGCGKVGTALTTFLAHAGYRPAVLPVAIPPAAQKTASIAGSNRFSDKPWEMTTGADIVFITTAR